jgi:acyl-CoA thioesterase-1
MQWMVLIFGSGLAFFLGVGLLLASFAASLVRWRGSAASATILAAVGLIVVALSGTPLALWFCGMAFALTVAWLASVRLQARNSWRRGLAALVAMTWLAAAAYEFQFQLMPTVEPVSSRRLYLFGDSLAAGVGSNEQHLWPQMLVELHRLDLTNHARAGATAAIALRAAQEISFNGGVVLLEIGGNDLLGSTTVEEFERDLDALLKLTCQPGVQVVMFELPIPPLCNGYGRVQRQLAARYGAALIPKRVLASVIAGKGSTIDSLHLSAKGHLAMAEAVWQVLAPAYEHK